MKKAGRTRRWIVAVAVVGLLVVVPGVSEAGGLAQGGGANRIDGSFKLLPIPYLNYDRSIGFQFGALPLAMFNPVKNDTISPSSIAGLFGMYSTNDTWVVMGFARLYLHEDDWRITGAGGTGTYNFQFYVDGPINGWLPYATDMDIAFVKAERRLVERLYGGLSYVYLDFATTVGDVPYTQRTDLHGLGLNLDLDHRDNVYYPRSGCETGVDLFAYPEFLGNDDSAEKIEFEYNRYVSVGGDRDVVAGRFFAGVGLGDLTFNQQFVVGQRRDIRGYTQGEFRGNTMLALQGEYRWNFRERLGLVGFAGVATVFDANNADDDGKLLPGVGTGVRFTMDRKTHMNVGMDVAVGRDDWGIYFRFGEAF